ncbi:MAG TPA: hypothetical protein VIL25_01120 [Vicinamibacterales bacterium]
MRRLLFAACFLEVGLLLVILPWTTFWDNNYLFDLVPRLRDGLHSSYVRGAVSGLGLLNIGLGVHDVSLAVSSWLDGARRDRSLAKP